MGGQIPMKIALPGFCTNCTTNFIFQTLDPGDLSERQSIRARCPKSFKWLLQKIIPQLGVPDIDSIAWGGVSKDILKKKFFSTKYSMCIIFSPQGC